MGGTSYFGCMTNLDAVARLKTPAKAKVAVKAKLDGGVTKSVALRTPARRPAAAAITETTDAPPPGTPALATIAPLICNHVMIRMATRQLGQLFDGVVTSTSLKATQCGLLMQIEALRTPTMKDLAKTLVMDLSALGHTLKPLIRDGYVKLVPDLDDRRSKRVDLTSAGAAKMVEIKQLWREATIRFETALGYEKAQDLRATLTVVASDDFGQAFRAAKVRKKAG